VITNIYKEKIKGPNLMEFFTAIEKIEKALKLTTRAV
jgi:hypothetical protein